MKMMRTLKKRNESLKCWTKLNNHPKMTDVTGKEDPDLVQDHVTEIVTGIVKDVVPDLEIAKLIVGSIDPDLNHERGINVDQEKMNLAKEPKDVAEEIEKKEKIVKEKKMAEKEARIRCLLKKLTKCV